MLRGQFWARRHIHSSPPWREHSDYDGPALSGFATEGSDTSRKTFSERTQSLYSLHNLCVCVWGGGDEYLKIAPQNLRIAPLK